MSSFDLRCKGKGGVWDVVEILECLFHFRWNGYKGPKQKGGGVSWGNSEREMKQKTQVSL